MLFIYKLLFIGITKAPAVNAEKILEKMLGLREKLVYLQAILYEQNATESAKLAQKVNP